MAYDEFIKWVEVTPANLCMWCDYGCEYGKNNFGSRTPLTAEELKEWFTRHPDEEAKWVLEWEEWLHTDQ